MRRDLCSLSDRQKEYSVMSRPKGDGKGRLGGGRKPGQPNKVTKEMREVLAPLISDYISGAGIGENRRTLANDLAVMEPEDRAKVITNLVPYVMPKLASVEVKQQSEGKTFKDELDELEQS